MFRLDQAHFSFGGKPILENVSLLVPEGARVGLLGRNGAGKTTLFRLILGELELESGTISIPRGRRAVYLPQHPSAPPGETILRHVLESHPSLREIEDQILRVERRMSEETDPARIDRLVERHRTLSRDFEERGGYELEAKVAGILEGLGFARDDLLQEIGPLSPGEKNRVALAKVLLAEADILLLDEPTNHLDLGMVEWLEELLRSPPPGGGQRPATVVVASHDRWFLNRFADRICELREGGLHLYSGNYDDFARQRAEEIERQEKEFRIQQVEIAKDLEFIRRNFAAQKARQAKSREKRLNRMGALERPQREARGPRIRFLEIARAGNDVLRVDEADFGYGERVLIEGARLELTRGEKVAVLGPNGCGKTTLLKSLMGLLPLLGGAVKVGQRTRIGYYAQELARVGSAHTVFEEVHDLMPRATNQEVRDLLAAFLFCGDEIALRTAALSGGEKARLALLRLIISGANLLVLDEPTNHLDVYARAALEEALLEFPESILFVSHDRYFVDRVADRVLAVHACRLRELPGGYGEYRRLCLEEATRKAGEGCSGKRGEKPGEKAGQRPGQRPGAESGQKPGGLPAGLRRRAEERLLAQITAAEGELRERQEESGLEANYRSPEAMRRLKQDIAALEEKLSRLYREWEGIA